MLNRSEYHPHTRRSTIRWVIPLGLSGTPVLLLVLTGCGTILQLASESLTGISLTGSPTVTQVATTATTATVGTVTPSATGTPRSVTNKVTGSYSVYMPATYPGGFFLPGQDISNSATGEGKINPYSTTRTVQATVTSANAASRPQIQFRDSVTLATVFTSGQNFSSSTLSASFVPTSTNPLYYSVIDTGVTAAGVSYTIQIQQ